jgi:hypothetical protein
MSTELAGKIGALAPLLSRSVDSELPERELRGLLADLTREARALGLHVEQLLIMLKAASARRAIRAGDDDERRRRERLVSLCIDAYYSAPRTA